MLEFFHLDFVEIRFIPIVGFRYSKISKNKKHEFILNFFFKKKKTKINNIFYFKFFTIKNSSINKYRKSLRFKICFLINIVLHYNNCTKYLKKNRLNI